MRSSRSVDGAASTRRTGRPPLKTPPPGTPTTAAPAAHTAAALQTLQPPTWKVRPMFDVAWTPSRRSRLATYTVTHREHVPEPEIAQAGRPQISVRPGRPYAVEYAAMTLSLLDWLLMLVYFAFVLGIGFALTRRT